MSHIAKRAWLALAVLAVLYSAPTPAAATPTLEQFAVFGGGGGVFSYPTGVYCGLWHVFVNDANGNPVQFTPPLSLPDGTYTVDMFATGGAVPGESYQIHMEFDNCCYGADIAVSTDPSAPQDPVHVSGQTTITLTNFTWYTDPTDRVGTCYPSPDGYPDSRGQFTLEVHTQPTSTGPIHLWSGEGDADDAVGGANGALGGTTAFATGLSGQAFSFDGQESSIVSLPVDINPNALPQMTVVMFVKLRSIANNLGWVFGHDNGGYDRSLNLHDIRYNSGVAGGTGVNPHASILPLSLNQWHCVAASYDRDNATATFYADGVAQTVFAIPGPGEVMATLGGLQNFAGHTVDGLVDEVFLFNRVLTSQEIDEIRAQFPGNQPPDVSGASPSIASIWPPNNKMVDIAINGITDPDGDAVSITIDSITNNETGSSDAGGIGTSIAQVRASRNGKGSGRTYTISFTASDGKGGTASGSVTVAVAHDQGKRAKPAAVESASWGEIKSMTR